MTITARRNAYRKHYLFHDEVQVEGCKFCFPKPDNHTNVSKRSDKRFVCTSCKRTLAWAWLHKSSKLKKNICMSCYWQDKPDLKIGVDRKVLFGN